MHAPPPPQGSWRQGGLSQAEPGCTVRRNRTENLVTERSRKRRERRRLLQPEHRSEEKDGGEEVRPAELGVTETRHQTARDDLNKAPQDASERLRLQEAAC